MGLFYKPHVLPATQASSVKAQSKLLQDIYFMHSILFFLFNRIILLAESRHVCEKLIKT